jgi:hypothetical protein
MNEIHGMAPGDACGRNGCEGIMRGTGEGCSCHLSAPCASCMAPAECNVCDARSDEGA